MDEGKPSRAPSDGEAELAKEPEEVGDSLGAMGAVAGSDSASSTPPTVASKKKVANLRDPYSIKRLLDDATSELVLGRGYVENHTLSNWKMFIGVITCGIALAAQFYPKKFPENKTFLIVCIVLYVILNVFLQVIIFTKEKHHILFTYPLRGSFSSTGLAVSTELPRASDLYTIRIASADPQSLASHAPVEFTKSVTKWFTKEGVLAEDLTSGLVGQIRRVGQTWKVPLPSDGSVFDKEELGTGTRAAPHLATVTSS